MPTADEIRDAERHLRSAEPRFGPVIDATGPCTLKPRRRQPSSHFEALARSIAFQQLAGRAASVIWGRARALVDGPFTPEAVLALPESSLRSAGLSGSKTASILDLAAHAHDGALRLRSIRSLDDAAVVDHLTQVRGIGEWTAHMFLIFRLGRLDVWPTGDLGVRQGFGRITERADVPSARELEPLGDPLRPYRSVAAWYCWRAVDTVTP